MRRIAPLLLAVVACGSPGDDPSAYTELGLPDARWQLGWSEREVAWDGLSPREKATVLRRELVVLRADAARREKARALLEELRQVDLTDPATADPELDRLRFEVRALRDGGAA